MELFNQKISNSKLRHHYTPLHFISIDPYETISLIGDIVPRSMYLRQI